jgi:hypothetical protein
MFRYVSADSTIRTNKSSYFDYGYINDRHPEWFLLADARDATPFSYQDENKRIRWDALNPREIDYGRFYIDIGNKDFQQWAVGEIIKSLEGTRETLHILTMASHWITST